MNAPYVTEMLKEDLFSEAGQQTLLEYSPFNLAANGDMHNESDGNEGGGQLAQILGSYVPQQNQKVHP